MIHIYQIEGMTCNNCKASVEKYLHDLPNISRVSINLEKGEAEVTMDQYLDPDALQKALPEKFIISNKDGVKGNASLEASTVTSQKTKLQQLKPLFLILLYITSAGLLLQYQNWSWNEFMLDFMGLFYIVFGFFKMLDLKGFPESFKMYDPLAKRLPIYGWMYPFIETVVGIMFLMRFEVHLALITTLVVLGITTLGVTKTLMEKKSIRCACLGTTLKLPMTEATLIENTMMISMAAMLLLNGF